MKKLLFSTILGCFLLACSDDIPGINSSQLLGSWQLRESYANGINTNAYFLLYEGKYYTFHDNFTYQGVYETGTWQLNNRRLRLQNGYHQSSTMRIVELTGNQLTIEYKLTDGELGFNLPGVRKGELITFKEVYRRP